MKLLTAIFLSCLTLHAASFYLDVTNFPTAALFDREMQSHPPRSLTVLGVGTFPTMGDTAWGPKSGQIIHGSGMGLTVLQFPSNSVMAGMLDRAHLIQPQSLFETNITVTDLTLDCNYRTGFVGTLNGISLHGSGNDIERLECINTAAITSDSSPTNYEEAYGIWCNPYPYPDGVNNRIKDCCVHDFHGNRVNDLQALGLIFGSGIVSGNVITGNSTNYMFGLGAGSHDSIVEGNILTHVVNGLHYDSGVGMTNVLVVNNQFIGVNEVADLANGRFQNVRFEGNVIQLTNVSPSSTIEAFYFHELPATFFNLDVGGNSVSLLSTPGSAIRFIWANNVRGITSHDNMFDAVLPNLFVNCTGAQSYNNWLFGQVRN